MDYPNYAALTVGLKYYTDAMRDFIRERLINYFRNDWWQRGVMNALREGQKRNLDQSMTNAPGKAKIGFLDPAYFEPVILRNFQSAFSGFFRDYQQTQAWLMSAAAARNLGPGHSETGDLSRDDVANHLLAMVRLLEQAKRPEAEQIESLRKRVLEIDVDPAFGPVRPAREVHVVSPAPSGALPYWWQVAEPHDAFQNPAAIDESMFAATLGDVAAGAARDEYLKPEIFFAHTYFTENLKQTIRDVASRLNLESGPSVTEMQTPFGGGKTHALLSLYHLVKDPQRSLSVPGVREALGDIHIPPEAKVLVFDGQLYGLEPIEKPDGTTVFTLWGELAYQADPHRFASLLKGSDTDGVAPGNMLYRQLLDDASPCLILIDELVSYLVKLKFSTARRSQNLYRQTVQFVQELLQLAGNIPGVSVLISLPKSQREFGGLNPRELQQELGILEELQARADRVVSKRTPVNDDEIYTLMSKRLFKHVDHVDREAAGRIAHAFHQLYVDNPGLYDTGTQTPEYFDRMVEAFPLHPELIDVLYKKWSTASDFPRTRTVLQLLASVVADQWVNRREDYAIQSSDMNLERERIRTKVISAAGSGGGYDGVVAKDIVGPDANADEWDLRRGGDYERHHIARGVATTLLANSFGGATRQGALPSDLYLGSVAPNLGPEYVREVLASLDQSLWYVHRDGELRRFQTRPNVYRIISQTAESQTDENVQDRLREAFGKAVGQAEGFRILEWAGTDGVIPDRPDPTIAVLAPTYVVQKEGESFLGKERIEQLWNRANGLRQWRNALILVAPDRELWERTEEAMRGVMAYEWTIASAEKRGLDLSDQELRRLRTELNDRRESLRTSVTTAYKWIFYPQGTELGIVGLSTATRGEQVASRVVKQLSDQTVANPKILERISPSFFLAKLAPRLWRDDNGSPLDLKQDLLLRLPQWSDLPILPRPEQTLRACIREGVQQELWAVAIGDSETQHFRRLLERPEEIDGIAELFDGSAALVRGDYLDLLRAELRPQVTAPVAPAVEENGHLYTTDNGRRAVGEGDGRTEPQIVTPPVIAAPARHSHVQLQVTSLPIGKSNNLQPYLFKVLQGQDPGATVNITIEVTSTPGIGEEVLNRNIVEGLEQLGINVAWKPE